MHIQDKLKLQGTVEIWKHKDGQDYRKGTLLERDHNTVLADGFLYTLLRQHYFTPPQVDNIIESTDAYGHPIDGMEFRNHITGDQRTKAIRRTEAVGSQTIRFLSTLRSGDYNGLTIDTLNLIPFVNAAGPFVDYYSGSDILLTPSVPDNYLVSQNTLLTYVNGTNPLIAGHSSEYDPEESTDVPVVVRDYRVQKKADGHWYVVFEPGTIVPNPSWVALYFRRTSAAVPGLINPMQGYTLTLPIVKDNTFALSIAWTNTIS